MDFHNYPLPSGEISESSGVPEDVCRLIQRAHRDLLTKQFGQKHYIRPENCHLLMHAHCIPSFVVLIESLINAYGFPPENIIIVSKLYSTIPEAERRLRALGVSVISAAGRYRIGRYDDAQCGVLSNACEYLCARLLAMRHPHERVIVVDDGGLISTMWSAVNADAKIETISIQHTASGIGRKGRADYRINVAQSAAKRIFEAKIIAQAVIRKVEHIDISLDGARIGIVGLGAIGRSLSRSLLAKGYSHAVLERPRVTAQMPSRNIYFDPDDFLARSDLIFGCSGSNWANTISRSKLVAGRTFVSCSSRDIEFKQLLETYSDGEVTTEIGDVALNLHPVATVLNGGFPINFDRKREWESFGEIGLTRYLILTAILFSQYLDTNRVASQTLMLPVELQKAMVADWLSATGYECRSFGVTSDQFQSERWWLSNSGGTEYHP